MTPLSTRIGLLGDRLWAEVDNADRLGNLTAYHHGLVRVVSALDSLEAKLRRRGF